MLAESSVAIPSSSIPQSEEVSTVCLAFQREELHPALDPHAGERAGAFLEQGLELILADGGRGGGAYERGLMASRKADVDRLAFPCGEGRSRQRLELDVERALAGRPLQIPAAQQLHRSRARCVRAGQRGVGEAALDHERLDSVAAQGHGAGKAARPGAHNHNLELRDFS
jgi:hypothetical protein